MRPHRQVFLMAAVGAGASTSYMATSRFLAAALVALGHALALMAAATPEWQLPATSVPVPEGGYPSPDVPADVKDAAQNAARVGVMRVTNEADFSAALSAPVRHIIIENHLDLRGFPAPPSPPTLFQLDERVQSIQVTASTLHVA